MTASETCHYRGYHHADSLVVRMVCGHLPYARRSTPHAIYLSTDVPMEEAVDEAKQKIDRTLFSTISLLKGNWYPTDKLFSQKVGGLKSSTCHVKQPNHPSEKPRCVLSPGLRLFFQASDGRRLRSAHVFVAHCLGTREQRASFTP